MTLVTERVSEVRGQATNCFDCLLEGAAESPTKKPVCTQAHVLNLQLLFFADAVKSSEDEEDDESSSEENKVSNELSTSNEKFQRKPQTFVVSFSLCSFCLENMNQ